MEFGLRSHLLIFELDVSTITNFETVNDTFSQMTFRIDSVIAMLSMERILYPYILCEHDKFEI